jgi:hypothetical protein
MSTIDKALTTSDESEMLNAAMQKLYNAFAISDALVSLKATGQLETMADVTLPILVEDLWGKLLAAKRSFEEYAEKVAQKEAA